MNAALKLASAVLCAGLLPGVAALAGIFDEPKNLKVLPENVSPQELRSTMRAFSRALGADCRECHVGDAGKSLESFDFQSDEKPRKEIARAMMRMTSDINARYLSSLDLAPDRRIEVACITCHRGQLRPRQTGEALDQALASGGVPSALAKYAELKKDYYGSHTFDFTEDTLSEYAQELARGGRNAEAIAMAQLATREFPESFRSRFLLGELYLAGGDRAAARAQFRHALELAPDQAWIRDRLESIEE